MCAFLLGTLLCVFVRVTTNGILYQQANYDLLKEGYFSFCFFKIQYISVTQRVELRGMFDV
jgi:hypothetical protein